MQHLASEDDASANIKGRRSGTRSNEMDIDSENKSMACKPAHKRDARKDRAVIKMHFFRKVGISSDIRNKEQRQEKKVRTRRVSENTKCLQTSFHLPAGQDKSIFRINLVSLGD